MTCTGKAWVRQMCESYTYRSNLSKKQMFSLLCFLHKHVNRKFAFLGTHMMPDEWRDRLMGHNTWSSWFDELYKIQMEII